jgi:hypothetical protein
VDSYDRASQAWDRARRPEDLAEVSSLVDEGRYAMVAARARLEGRPPPERRPPCFFDPRHGPSVEDVEWSPDGGQPRPVPVCAADATRIREGRDPMTREVEVDGQPVPYWNAGPAYMPWAGGFFGGGLLPGLFIGSMLGGGLWGGFGAGEAYGGEGEGGGDLGGGFGDLGGQRHRDQALAA